MAKTATANNLTAAVRTETGKGASRRARREGKRARRAVRPRQPTRSTSSCNARDFSAVLRHTGTNAVLTLDIEGKEQLALTKALEIHPIRRNIQHADLLVVRRGEKVTVEVNVVVEGEAVPAPWSPRTPTPSRSRPTSLSIPEQLTVSVEGVEAGTQFTAGQTRAAQRRHAGVRPRDARRQRGALRRPPRTSRAKAAARSLRTRPRALPTRAEAADARPSPSRVRAGPTCHGRAATGGRPGQPGTRTTPPPGTTSASWSPTSLPTASARSSRCTRSRAPRWPRAGSAAAGGAGQAALLHERVGPPGRPAGEVLFGGPGRRGGRSTTNSTSTSAASG